MIWYMYIVYNSINVVSDESFKKYNAMILNFMWLMLR